MDIPQVTSQNEALTGEMGQEYLATGKQVALRRWVEDVCDFGPTHTREYETVGYVFSGVLELELDGQIAKLSSGDSWLVPEQAAHRYRVLEPVVAVEATSPPARFGNRDGVVS